MASDEVTLIHIFVDHSNMWGGARLASRLHDPDKPDEDARISVRHLDRILGGRKPGVSTKIVSGGIPPGMEGVWSQYQNHGYDTQRLYRGKDWKERGVDHTIIGHMWRILARFRDAPTALVLASGDGKTNEFGTSFVEVVSDVLRRSEYDCWQVWLASFDWEYSKKQRIRSPTNQKMKKLVVNSERGEFVNLADHYEDLVYHEAKLLP